VLCHAGALKDGDLVARDLIYRAGTGEIYAVFYNEAHRRCNAPMHDRRARFMPHAAFEDPATPAEKLPAATNRHNY
jgi:hypothetical protein